MENNNFYIGQTRTSLSKRFENHKYAANSNKLNTTLCNAMKKYGSDMFTIEDVEVFQTDTKEELNKILNERETYYIFTLKPPYNQAPGGLGHTGIPWTDQRREAFKKLMSGPNNPNYGKLMSEETKNKLKNALKGRQISQESRQKISETMKGVPKSEATKKRMSEVRKGMSIPKGDDSKKAVKIDQYDIDGNFIKSFGSIANAAETIGCQRSGICFCLKGRIKTSAGFIWKYSI